MEYQDIISHSLRVHFVGIGGVSMSLLAQYLSSRGCKVSGSDAQMSKAISKLSRLGIPYQLGHKVELIKDADLVVVTLAIQEDNEELIYARLENKPILTRAELLGMVATDFDKVIAVAGTHGKTTTANMLYNILLSAGEKVSCHIGADIDNACMNYGDEYLVVEACEYKRSFLHLRPFVSVITNVELDHMDYYRDLDDIQDAFREFAGNGQKVIVGDNVSTQFLSAEKTALSVQSLHYNTADMTSEFSVITDRCLPLKLNMLGRHNVDNAILAMRVAQELGMSDQAIVNGLGNCQPVARRTQKLGEYKSAEVLIDYAHHPTEIECFHSVVESIYHKYVFIFQPHTFSRTKALLADFVRVLKRVPNLVIYKEYSARETSVAGMSAKELAIHLRTNKVKCKYIDTPAKLFDYLDCQEVDAYLFVGAGDIDKLAESLTE